MALAPPSWIGPLFLPCLPQELSALEKQESNKNKYPTKPQRPDHRLCKGYQEPAWQDDRAETKMEADGNEGQGLPEQGKCVWRRQQRPSGESAFTSGCRPRSTPASRLLARQGAGAARRKRDLRRVCGFARSGVTFGKCLSEKNFKAPSTSSATASNKRHKGDKRVSLLLSFFPCPTLFRAPHFLV